MRFSVIDEPQFNFDKIEFTLNTTGSNISGMENELRISRIPGKELIITQTSPKEIQLIKVYNISGTHILTIDRPGLQACIQTVGLSAGIYLIQVQTRDGIICVKIYIGS